MRSCISSYGDGSSSEGRAQHREASHTAPLCSVFSQLRFKALRSTRFSQIPVYRQNRAPTAPALGPAAALGRDLNCIASVEPLGPLFCIEAGEKDDRLNITPGPAPCQAVLRFNCGEGTQEIAQRHSLALNYGLVTL